MPPSKHARLGASKAYQWLACTPSIRLEEGMAPDESSVAAAEGTLAHAIAEQHMRQLLDGKRVRTGAKLRGDPLYRPVMEEHVSTYTDYLMEVLTEARQRTPDAIMLLEERVDFSDIVPEGFGTSDAILIADGTMHIFDFKYGKGVPVSAVENPQMRLYALGALAEYGALYDLHTVVTHIIQPRLDSITRETMDVSELTRWGDEFVKPRAQKAYAGEGKPTPGEHCRFCRFRNCCRAYAMRQLAMEQIEVDTSTNEPREPEALTPGEISKVLASVDELTRWAKSVKDWALDQCVNHGVSFPGWKLVEGRSNRVVSDDISAINALHAAGFEPGQVMKLRGLTELEELVGKKKLAEVLDGLIIKPAGKPVLAREDDKRPEISSAARAKSVFTPLDD